VVVEELEQQLQEKVSEMRKAGYDKHEQVRQMKAVEMKVKEAEEKLAQKVDEEQTLKEIVARIS